MVFHAYSFTILAIGSFTAFLSISPSPEVVLMANEWFTRRHQNHTIRKVKFLSKNSILTKPQHFHEFFTQIFFVKSKLSTAKKSKTTTFSRVFHPKKSTIFSGNQSWIFGQKMKISNSVKMYIWSHQYLNNWAVHQPEMMSKMVLQSIMNVLLHTR